MTMTARTRLCHFVIDVPDLDRGVTFWAEALDAVDEPLPEISSGVYRHLRLPDTEIAVLLQKTDDTKVSKERMHLDLEADDVEAEVKRLEALGATRWDHQQERGLTSGSCVTPGKTNSASFHQTTPTSSSRASHPVMSQQQGRDSDDHTRKSARLPMPWVNSDTTCPPGAAPPPGRQARTAGSQSRPQRAR